MIPERPPKSVAIIGMGASNATYLHYVTQVGTYKRRFNEVWAINSMAGVIQHDRVFLSDDPKHILEPLVEANPECSAMGMLHWLAVHPGPVYTSRHYKDYPGTVEYPLQAVLDTVNPPYLNTTVAYALAFALHLGVKEIGLYGCDFTYPDKHAAESGRGCVEFLLGIAFSRSVQITLPHDTTLMDMHVPDHKRFYGYATGDEVVIKHEPVEVDGVKGMRPIVTHLSDKPVISEEAKAKLKEVRNDLCDETANNGHDPDNGQQHECNDHDGLNGSSGVDLPGDLGHVCHDERHHDNGRHRPEDSGGDEHLAEGADSKPSIPVSLGYDGC